MTQSWKIRLLTVLENVKGIQEFQMVETRP